MFDVGVIPPTHLLPARHKTIRLPAADPRPLPRLAWGTCVLTAREQQILGWVARGKSDWQIGVILLISPKTVNYHVERAKRRLNASTRMQAALVASHLGLIEVPNIPWPLETTEDYQPTN